MPEPSVVLENLSRIGGGREKTVFEIQNSPEKVFVQYNDEQLRSPEFGKAIYYMQGILHAIAPNNFLDVSRGDAQGAIVEKVQGNTDFIKANAIVEARNDRVKNGEPWYTPIEDQVWLQEKADEIYGMHEFDSIACLLDEVLVPDENRSKAELSVPVNTIVINDHPVIVEMFNPIATVLDGTKNPVQVPSIKKDGLEKIITNGFDGQSLSEQQIKTIRRYHHRYSESVQKLLSDNAAAQAALDNKK